MHATTAPGSPASSPAQLLPSTFGLTGQLLPVDAALIDVVFDLGPSLLKQPVALRPGHPMFVAQVRQAVLGSPARITPEVIDRSAVALALAFAMANQVQRSRWAISSQ